MTAIHRIAALALALAALPAFAGGTATLETSTEGNDVRMQVRWSGDNMRMELPGQQSAYMLLRGDKSYTVMDQGGRQMVLDLESMNQMASGVGADTGMDAGMAADQPKSVQAISATGEHETIAGIEGEVHRIEWTDQRSREHSDTAVLSDNEQVLELTRSFRRIAAATSDAPDALGDALAERDLGVLRFGDRFRVASISADAPAAATFELPAEPMDMEEMMQGMGAGGQ